jgi:hypothetical protein
MTEERDAFEQFVEEFDTVVEPTNEPEPEPVEVPAEGVEVAEPPTSEAPPEPTPVEPTTEAATQSAPAASPSLAEEMSRLREEIARLREPPAQQAQQPAESYDQLREKAYGELEKVYRPPEQEVENFLSDPGTVMAKMAARLHVAVLENVSQLVQQHMSRLPSVVEQQNLQRRQEETFWQKFDGRWPGLRTADPQYRQKAALVGATYRQFKPAASETDFIEQVGAQLSLLLGVVPSQPQAPASSPPSPPTKPVSARGGRGSGRQSASTPWDELARDFETDDNW